MRRKWRGSRLLGLAIAVARFTMTAGAAAHGDIDDDRSGGASGSVTAAGRLAGPSLSSGDGEARSRWRVSLDAVLAWGKVPFAVQTLPTTGTQAITYSRSDATPSDVQSFVLGADFSATDRLSVGARLPFMLGTLSPAGSAARAVTSLGNVELEGGLRSRVARRAELSIGLGVDLPTAPGHEIPSALVDVPASRVDASAYDRFSVARAAQRARGDEDDELFAPGYLGAIPKVSLVYDSGRFAFEPYLKVENLLRTDESLATAYVGAVVAGVRADYRISRRLDASARAWTHAGFAGTPEDKKTAIAVEPDVRIAFGTLTTYGGIVLPVLGDAMQNGFFGVRLGLFSTF